METQKLVKNSCQTCLYKSFILKTNLIAKQAIGEITSLKTELLTQKIQVVNNSKSIEDILKTNAEAHLKLYTDLCDRNALLHEKREQVLKYLEEKLKEVKELHKELRNELLEEFKKRDNQKSVNYSLVIALGAVFLTIAQILITIFIK